jgi:TPP-dependent pyruvate/acetoin dehydrogenase alpha subunit
VEESGVAQEQLDSAAAEVEEQLGRAIEFAEAGTHPDPEEALEDVYADDLEGEALR